MGKKGKAPGKKPKGRAAARGKAQKNSPRGGPGGGWANNFVRQSDGLFADSGEDPLATGNAIRLLRSPPCR